MIFGAFDLQKKRALFVYLGMQGAMCSELLSRIFPRHLEEGELEQMSNQSPHYTFKSTLSHSSI